MHKREIQISVAGGTHARALSLIIKTQIIAVREDSMWIRKQTASVAGMHAWLVVGAAGRSGWCGRWMGLVVRYKGVTKRQIEVGWGKRRTKKGN